jgi:hypothetical protein
MSDFDVDKFVAFTKELFAKTIGKHSITLYKPRTNKGDVRAYTVPRLFQLLANDYSTLHSYVESIESWPESYRIYVREESHVKVWLEHKHILIEGSKCRIFVPNTHEGVLVRFSQIPSAWDTTIVRTFAEQFGSVVSTDKKPFFDGHPDTAAEVVFQSAPAFLVVHKSLKVTNEHPAIKWHFVCKTTCKRCNFLGQCPYKDGDKMHPT